MRPAISVVLVLACALPVLADPSAGVIRFGATYPGADARTVDEMVLTPLFAKIVGVKGVIRIESEARNDGTGTLALYFEPKADLNLAQAVVQNRANLALSALPAPCRQPGPNDAAQGVPCEGPDRRAAVMAGRAGPHPPAAVRPLVCINSP